MPNEPLTIREMLDRFRNDGSCENSIIDRLQKAEEALAACEGKLELSRTQTKDAFARVSMEREDTVKAQQRLAQVEEVAEDLVKSLEACRSVLNRVTGIIVEQAKAGRYPESLLGQGWQFATDAGQDARSAIQRATALLGEPRSAGG